MTIYSMTGYSSILENSIKLEIKTLNSRFLDYNFRLNDELRIFEPILRELISQKLRRGKVEVRAEFFQQNSENLKISSEILKQLVQLQHQVQKFLPQSKELSVFEALTLIENYNFENENNFQEIVLNLVNKAIQEVLKSRQNEGQRLAENLNNCLVNLQNLVNRIEPIIPQLIEQQKGKFLTRWQEIMQDLTENAHEKALIEATSFAMKIDINEEISRLKSHILEIKNILDNGGEVGRRLDFLIQELHRESNTLGAKSSSLELTRLSLEMKVIIEQMREQVQNIE